MIFILVNFGLAALNAAMYAQSQSPISLSAAVFCFGAGIVCAIFETKR